MAKIYPGSRHQISFEISDTSLTTTWSPQDRDRISIYAGTGVTIANSAFTQDFLADRYRIFIRTSAAVATTFVNTMRRYLGWPIYIGTQSAFLLSVNADGQNQQGAHIVNIEITDTPNGNTAVQYDLDTFTNPYYITFGGRIDSMDYEGRNEADSQRQAEPPMGATDAIITIASTRAGGAETFQFVTELRETVAGVLDDAGNIALAAEDVVEGIITTPGDIGATTGVTVRLEGVNYTMTRSRVIDAQTIALRLTRSVA